MTEEMGDSMTVQPELFVSSGARPRNSNAAPDGVLPRPRTSRSQVAAAAVRRLDVVPQQPNAHRLPTRADTLEVDSIAAAWKEFKADAGRLVRERLILHYAPLVTAVASRVGMRLPNSVEHADLVSYGMFGLIDAIEKYELDRAVKFETYASARIRGAIIDELRAMDWVPRSVRTKVLSFWQFRQERILMHLSA